MKQIQPVSIWVNGQVKTGSWLNAYIINDNLSSSATFYWSILASGSEEGSAGEKLSEGNSTIDGENYIVWGEAADINLAAYQWIASQLGLTLI
jgi:hypothetical protein